MSDKIIINLDASASAESSCDRRLHLNIVEGWKEKVNNNDMEFGSAVHEYIKVIRTNPGRYDLATVAAVKRYSGPMNIKTKKQYLTKDYLMLVCQTLWMTYLEKDLFQTVVENGKPLVELKFSWPFYVDDEVEVRLAGTIDDVCKHKHGTYAIRDYKTTSVGEQEPYLRGYYLSPQLLFYRLAVRYHALRYPDSIWAVLESNNVHCFIDGIFLQGASKFEFKRSDIIAFSNEQIDEFESILKRLVMQLVDNVKAKRLPARQGMLNGSCTTKFGLCKYFNACVQPDERAFFGMLKQLYIQKHYDPLCFN